MSAPLLDLDKLEQAAKASHEHSVAIGGDWFQPDDFAVFASQEDAEFMAAASPLVVLELINRLRTAEENCQAATLRANANAEMLKALQSQSPVAAVPDAPIGVFDQGPWIWAPTGEEFSGKQLDEAAFAEYRRKLVGDTDPESGSQQ